MSPTDKPTPEPPATEPEGGEGSAAPRVPDTLPIMPIDNIVIFPYMIAPILVADERSKRLVDEALGGNRFIGLFVRRAVEEGYTGFDQLYGVGTAGAILKMLRMPDGTVRLLVHGVNRIRITEPLTESPYMRARVTPIEETTHNDTETLAMVKSAQKLLQKVVELSNLPEDLAVAASNLGDPGKLCDLIATNLSLQVQQQQEILETTDVKERLRKVLAHLNSEIELLQLGERIQGRVRTAIDKSQREFMLREQLKAIRSELGEGEEGGSDLAEIRKVFADEAAYPEPVRRVALKELDRLEAMSPNSAEYTVSRTYIDWLQNLPWMKSTQDNLDIRRAERILNEDHFGLEKVKQRILEYLAVLKLKRDMKSPILCFVGPPGVGKTSLGRSIARALGRKFQRFSLGGLHDEAEIRGHRRTYIGAMPGRIIKALRNCETNNPVVMLDEIDKVASDFRGDPASALLEVLDPEQNNTFTDNFIDLPFDLSRVMFIATANMLDTVAPPLRDRMEIITISGYTLQEKVEIAKRHLIPKQIAANGLTPQQIAFTDAAIERIIDDYTREAGLRNLEREIGSICRKVARAVAARRTRGKITVTPALVAKHLGPPRFDRSEDIAPKLPGVATGLAWTPTGGELLQIEAAAMPGKGQLVLTGKLGDIMKESAQAALTYLRANADRFQIDGELFAKMDIHVHVPEGAIPKDGPSAGIAIATSLASLLKNRRVAAGLAMTGEITLKGNVLPIGGVKEKLLAAHRAGIRRVLLPARNRKDLVDIPKEVRRALDIKFVSRMPEVLREAFADAAPPPRRRRPSRAQPRGLRDQRGDAGAGRRRDRDVGPAQARFPLMAD